MIFLVRFYVYIYIYEVEWPKNQAPIHVVVDKIIIEIKT